MTRITVQGLGLVGGFGTGVAALAEALAAGQVQPSTLDVPTGEGTVTLPAFRADTSALKDLVPAKVLRRMDHFTRMGLLGARLALADAGLEPSGLEGVGVILASGYGATATTYGLLDSMINDGDACTSPTHFANSLHNACSGNLAIALGAKGPNLTVSQFHLSVPSALLTARLWLETGRVERVLFGALDELSDLTGYLWARQHGTGRPVSMTPLLTAEDTALPGEGAAFLVLSRCPEAQPGYCTLESVATGRCLDGERLPGRAGQDLLLLGADGRQADGARYAIAAQGARIACTTPLYGSMPAAPAFDLAVAALMLRNGTVYPTPFATACDLAAEVAPAGPLGTGRITCLTLAEDHGYGQVVLGASGA